MLGLSVGGTTAILGFAAGKSGTKAAPTLLHDVDGRVLLFVVRSRHSRIHSKERGWHPRITSVPVRLSLRGGSV